VGRTVSFLRGVGRALQRIPARLAWLPAGLWMGLIWVLSSLSADEGRVGHLTAFVSNLAHAPAFGLLALWLALLLPRAQGWPRLDRRAVLALLAVVLCYGAIDEWHQSFTPGRDPSALDVLTDVVGGACTLWIVAYLSRPAAAEAGLWRRLALGLFLCALTAALA